MAGGVVEGPEGLLLVRNRRRNGELDWSPPGGVVEVHEGESVTDGLTREVQEETGLAVTEWAGPLYRVEVEAPDLGWRLAVEVHRAVSFVGELYVDDPDGIVVDARFAPPDACPSLLAGVHPWVREPLVAWLGERWTQSRTYGYRVDGHRGATTVTRVGPA